MKKSSTKKVKTDAKIDVSFVMSVYNKEYYLPSVLKALLNQSGVKNPEYIFVDDMSKDSSVEIIRKMTKGIKNVTIVAKDKNEGISTTCNQGIALAKGEWVRMLDSDDIFPLDSTEIMLDIAKKNKADMVYGRFTKTGKEPEDLTQEKTNLPLDYKTYDNALHAVLTGRFTRMGQLIKRKVLQGAKGADPFVFIQDESIPLRCAAIAKGKIVKMQNYVVLVPKETNNLSKNTVQLDHDRFFANYNMLVENYKNLDKKMSALMNLKAISANWKYVKKNIKSPYLTSDFTTYLYTKVMLPKPDFNKLKSYAKRFSTLSGVLRSKEMKEACQKGIYD